jgi:hypothetical protein
LSCPDVGRLYKVYRVSITIMSTTVWLATSSMVNIQQGLTTGPY